MTRSHDFNTHTETHTDTHTDTERDKPIAIDEILQICQKVFSVYIYEINICKEKSKNVS